MDRKDFDRAKAACKLTNARFEGGSIMTGKPATIIAPAGETPGSWDEKGGCVARLFGGDGVMKAPSVDFMIRFNS